MRRSSLVVRISLAVSLLLVATPPAAAYTVLKTYIGASKYWPGSQATWTVSTSGMPGVDDESFHQAIGGAFNSWEDIDCSVVSFVDEGFSAFDPGDGIHFTVQTSNWDPTVGDALAYTVTDNKNNGKIDSADIVFNAAETEWTISTAVFGKKDIQGVAAHEIGHAIGMDHSRDFDATMFFSGGSGDLRTLEDDDIRGACYLYPAVDFDDGQACDACHETVHCVSGYCLDSGGGHSYCGADCTSNAQCPQGFSCQSWNPAIPDQCVPNNGYCHQWGSNIPLGEFCYGMETCSSGVCLVLPGEAYCSKTCTSSCPSGFICQTGYCLKKGSQPYGGACENGSDCETGTCILMDWSSGSPVCTQGCGDNGGGGCPDGNQCIQDIYCVPPGAGSNGAPCLNGAQCAGTYCLNGACTQPCGSGSPCPEGTSCGDVGFCLGGAPGGSCSTTPECPTGLECQKSSKDGPGTCVRACSPLTDQGCLAGEVCQWRWESWTEEITGTCVPSNGGESEGEACDGSVIYCEADLECAVGVYGHRECHRDCKLFANSLGCLTGQKCVSLELADDPKHGICQLKYPPPPPSDDPTQPPGGGDGTTPDPGTEAPPSNGGISNGGVIVDEGTAGEASGGDSGDSPGCSGAGAPRSAAPWILGLLLSWCLRRRCALQDLASGP